MPLRLGDEVPDFTAETTEGTVNFHQFLGDGWGILFSRSIIRRLSVLSLHTVSICVDLPPWATSQKPDLSMARGSGGHR